MIVCFYCKDYSGDEPARLRKEYLKPHLDYIEANMDAVKVAGPLYDDRQNIVGSCLIFKADSEADARRLFEADPYYSCGGIWETVEVTVFNTVAGEWVGGRLW